MISLGTNVSTQVRGCLCYHLTIHLPVIYVLAANTRILLGCSVRYPVACAPEQCFEAFEWIAAMT